MPDYKCTICGSLEGFDADYVLKNDYCGECAEYRWFTNEDYTEYYRHNTE